MRIWMVLRSTILLVGISFFLSGIAHSAEPFVSGYDRFAPSKSISESLAGQLLLTELSCTACHETDDEELRPKNGPDLNGVGSRVNADWLRDYLAAPHDIKPGTTMPDMLAGLPDAKKQNAITALTAFLMNQKQEFPEIIAGGLSPVPYEFWNKGDAELGKGLFHRVGCIACHEPDQDYETAEYKPTPLDQMIEQLDDEELKELGLSQHLRPVKSVPHGELGKKYSPKSLTYFLLNPEKYRPAGRMPNFKLAPMEASHLAAYLQVNRLGKSRNKKSDFSRDFIEKGRQLFSELQCSSCHQAKGIDSKSSAKKLSELNLEATQICVTNPGSNQPRYPLSEKQAISLKVAVQTLKNNDSPEQHLKLELRMLQLNCYGCHERNERGGVGRNRKAYLETVRHIDLGDEGRIPPPLTGVGQKLNQNWLKRVLDGTGVVRPHLSARMPKYPVAQVKSLPAQFAAVDDFQQQTEQEVFKETKNLATSGRMLLDTGCVQCHPIRGEALPGVVGVDLSGVTDRLHPAWFKKFMFNPGAVKTRTRMPTFFPNGKSSNSQLLDGDVDLQIASLWVYLKDLKNQPLPEKIITARSQTFELVPKEKPIVLRTFMDEAGTHAIAVGYPEKLHFAYDAEQVRIAEIWTGRFLDAQGTWYERFAPPADPLGESHRLLLSGPTLTYQADDPPVFKGYRLQKSGRPTFLFRLAEFDIEEQIFPTKTGRLRRIWTIRTQRQSSGIHPLNLHLLPDAKHVDPTTITSDAGLKVHLKTTSKATPTKDGWNLSLLPLTAGKPFVIEVEYQW